MENNKDNTKADDKPTIMNYDYVWGSDQDEYVNADLQAEEAPEQGNDNAQK
ncbi:MULTISPECIES: hypothetical protein [Bacillales]|uniref:hypothetical protein n=1 Tax=Bacillales TaxID=1385 RepID=UPI000AA25FA4|nr:MULTISPECIES: hypothetical protein [Bacillales]